MSFLKRSFLIGLVAVAAVFAAACPERTSIADIQSNPSKFQDKTVAVAGVVKDSYGLNIPGTQVRGGIYKIDDGTGSIWIVTEDAVPGKGAEIGVEGRIGSGINWNGKNYGLGMYEKQRKFRRR
ncbi:MAG: hypothetical protein QUS14_01055 [Pyrinomonadaceae bacterium]|nr:hypothetical protein [Pyrinomonadaceae bacterium]